jgi:hypothetical protein
VQKWVKKELVALVQHREKHRVLVAFLVSVQIGVQKEGKEEENVAVSVLLQEDLPEQVLHALLKNAN